MKGVTHRVEAEGWSAGGAEGGATAARAGSIVIGGGVKFEKGKGGKKGKEGGAAPPVNTDHNSVGAEVTPVCSSGRIGRHWRR